MKILQLKLDGQVVLIDEQDKDFFDSIKWNLIRANQLEAKYYLMTIIKKRTFYFHRMIMGVKKRTDFVDHINRNTLDCRKENLRIITPSMNRINCTVRKNKTSSIYKGVFKSKEGRTKPFYSQVKEGKKCYYLGSFYTELDAAMAYNNKIKELYNIDNPLLPNSQ